ncbi:MAG: ZIP family metal transporter, partial [Candidatus Limnocylindrales bacterium]
DILPLMSPLLSLIAILPFFSTLLGGFAALRLRHRLHPIMAAAAGITVATALADLLPESVDLIGGDRATLVAGTAAIVGYLIYTAVEALVHQQTYEHGHPPSEDPDQPHEHDHGDRQAHGYGEPQEEQPPQSSAIGLIGPIGVIVHSVLDGLAIGLGFEAGTEVGLIVTLAVIGHDFADGLNVVTLALAGGRSRRSAAIFLAFDAAAPVLGFLASAVVHLAPEHLGLLLAGFGGAFLAIGAGHLLPEAQHRRPGTAPQLVLIAGVAAAVVTAVRLALG